MLHGITSIPSLEAPAVGAVKNIVGCKSFQVSQQFFGRWRKSAPMFFMIFSSDSVCDPVLLWQPQVRTASLVPWCIVVVCHCSQICVGWNGVWMATVRILMWWMSIEWLQLTLGKHVRLHRHLLVFFVIVRVRCTECSFSTEATTELCSGLTRPFLTQMKRERHRTC